MRFSLCKVYKKCLNLIEFDGVYTYEVWIKFCFVKIQTTHQLRISYWNWEWQNYNFADKYNDKKDFELFTVDAGNFYTNLIEKIDDIVKEKWKKSFSKNINTYLLRNKSNK